MPACANKKLLTDILRNEWGFKGTMHDIMIESVSEVYIIIKLCHSCMSFDAALPLTLQDTLLVIKQPLVSVVKVYLFIMQSGFAVSGINYLYANACMPFLSKNDQHTDQALSIFCYRDHDNQSSLHKQYGRHCCCSCQCRDLSRRC